MVFSMRYRRRFDIVADIIDAAQQGARKTKIMYFANLSYLLLTKYLDDAVRAGFLKPAGDMFFATPKGQEFLDRYQRLSGRASRLEANLEELRNEADELEQMCRPRRNGSKGCRRSRLAILG
jgi:predicted transcriptional regulator